VWRNMGQVRTELLEKYGRNMDKYNRNMAGSTGKLRRSMEEAWKYEINM
jgi:hypothetical protein